VQSDTTIRVSVINMSADKKTKPMTIDKKDTLQNIKQAIQERFDTSQAITVIKVKNAYLEDDRDIRELQANDELRFEVE
jgi:uncharacterized membrane protein